MLVSRTYFTAAQEPGGLSVARRQRTGLRSPRRSPLPNDPAREMRRQLTLWVSDRPVGVRLCRARGGSATGQDYAIYLGTLSIASTLAEVERHLQEVDERLHEVDSRLSVVERKKSLAAPERRQKPWVWFAFLIAFAVIFHLLQRALR